MAIGTFADLVRKWMKRDAAFAAAFEKIVEKEAVEQRALIGQLLPCPCCGGQVGFDDAHARGCGFFIECTNCNLRMWSFETENPPTLIMRWNSRTAKKA